MSPLQKLKRWIYVATTPLRHKYTYWKMHRGDIRPFKILKFPHYVLNRPAEPITKFDNKLKMLVARMVTTMQNPPWGKAAGLAAPQIGKSLRLFIITSEIFINPTLTKSSLEHEYKEGCFSLTPNKFDYPVRRAQSVWVKFQDIEGNWHNEKYNGFEAEVIKHEYDHLSGHCLLSGSIEVTGKQKLLMIFQAMKYWLLKIL
jgi:peptide deformylase